MLLSGCEKIHNKLQTQETVKGEGMKKSISKPARERLIQLVRLLEQVQSTEPLAVITSADIEKRTGWTNATVRRDISLLGINCASSAGYSIAALIEAIKAVLNISRSEKKCCIVGLGRLGSALLEFEGFARSSFKIAAGFDSNVNRTEILSAPFPLYPTSKMEAVIAQEGIEYGILAVPERAAQEAADRLCKCGIKGIVNYTSVVLRVNDGTMVENISVIDALQKLSSAV